MRTKTFIIALLVLGALQVRAQVNNVTAFSQKLQEREQKKKDEVKALEDLLVQYKALVPGLVNLKLTVQDPIEVSKGQFVSMIDMGEPRGGRDITFGKSDNKIKYIAHHFSHYTQRTGHIKKELYVKNGEAIEANLKNWLAKTDDCVLMSINIDCNYDNDKKEQILKLFDETINKIALSDEEIAEFEKNNVSYTTSFLLFEPCIPQIWRGIALRNSPEVLSDICTRFLEVGYEALSNFVIKDNLGVTSSFQAHQIMKNLIESNKGYDTSSAEYLDPEGKLMVINTKIGILTSGEGLFSPAVYIEQLPYASFTFKSYQDRGYLNYKNYGDGWVVHFLIPKSEFSKYTNFTIEQRK